mmetsp:Transcript_2554/g.4650  ORF Transcript_2554/g.4650 Transcript_2554/m.4650 type:complete len:84 (-) Transcript_2554:85-336(-)
MLFGPLLQSLYGYRDTLWKYTALILLFYGSFTVFSKLVLLLVLLGLLVLLLVLATCLVTGDFSCSRCNFYRFEILLMWYNCLH